jgi:hypothetical protein
MTIDLPPEPREHLVSRGTLQKESGVVVNRLEEM